MRQQIENHSLRILLRSNPGNAMEPKHLNSLNGQLRINVDEIYEVRHWAKQLGVSTEKLLAVIAQAGPFVDAVRLQLKDNIHPDNPLDPCD